MDSDNSYKYYRLENGIGVVFKRNHSIVAHSGVFINVGSRDEEKDRPLQV